MPFKNYLCWNPDIASDQLDTEAEQHSTEFFSAIHSPVSAQRMFYKAPGDASAGILSPGDIMTEQSILEEFMYKSENFDGNILMPIIGASGSGKTHLIKWLKANIKDTERRKVLLIPRINISLKQIIELMLTKLTGTEFEKYRIELRNAPLENIDHDQNKEQLISQFANSIGTGLNDYNLNDQQIYFRKGLNALFTDPFFRENWWLNPGGFIDRLTANTSGKNVQDLHNTEKSLGFTVTDLPKNIPEVNTRASEVARKFYNQLSVFDREDLAAVVALVNSSKESAVKNLLKLGGVNDLERMMIEVRQHYKIQNIELVVLIEDFARLEGVDKALLSALMAKKHQSGETDLCAIRTAFACTRDRYDKLPDTVKTRATPTIQVGVVDNNRNPIQNWTYFAGRYLNAIRRFAQTTPLNEINPCALCTHQSDCHKAFGTIEIKLNDNPDETTSVIGLYPLNKPLLQKTYDRFLTELFMPRDAIKYILTPILASHGKKIADGTFPPKVLVESLKGPTVPAETNARLKKLVDSERQISLVDLWSSTTNEQGVHNDVRSAFNIGIIESLNHNTKPINPNVEISDKPTPIDFTPPLNPPTIPSPGVLPTNFDDQANALIADLDLWTNGQVLTSENETKLRDYVFKAIEKEIDWVGNGINQKFHSHQTKALFRGKNICFRSDTRTDGQVRLQIPPDGVDRAESAVALQALIKRKSTGSWNFPDGQGVDGYIKAQFYIKSWAAEVLNQIVVHYGPNTILDPIAPAVESLCLAHVLNGRNPPPEDSDLAAIDFLCQEIDLPNTARSQKWHGLQIKLQQDKSLQIVRSSLLTLVGLLKGRGIERDDETQVVMLAPNRVLPLIRRTLENYKPTEFKLLPLERAGDGNEGIALRRCNQFLRDDLEGAVADEINESIGCCTTLEDLFGLSKNESLSKETIVSTLEKTLDAVNKARDLGNLGGNLQVDQLRNSIETLRLADLGNLLKACRLVREKTTSNQLPVVANVDASNRKAVVKEVKNLSDCLSATQRQLVEECANLTKNTGIDASITQIVNSLNSLKQAIETLQTGSNR